MLGYVFLYVFNYIDKLLFRIQHVRLQYQQIMEQKESLLKIWLHKTMSNTRRISNLLSYLSKYYDADSLFVEFYLVLKGAEITVELVLNISKVLLLQYF